MENTENLHSGSTKKITTKFDNTSFIIGLLSFAFMIFLVTKRSFTDIQGITSGLGNFIIFFVIAGVITMALTGMILGLMSISKRLSIFNVIGTVFSFLGLVIPLFWIVGY